VQINVTVLRNLSYAFAKTFEFRTDFSFWLGFQTTWMVLFKHFSTPLNVWLIVEPPYTHLVNCEFE